MKIIPQRNNLLVRMENIPTESGSVELPDEAKEEPYGIVIAVGPECKSGFKPGDKVLTLANNLIGHDQYGDPRFILPETAVYATVVLDQNQDGSLIVNN